MSAMPDDEGDRDVGAGCLRRAGNADEAGSADAARARLAELRHSAAETYAEITVADDALRVLARHRMTAERNLRLAAVRHQAAERAAAGHAQARPGPAAQLTTRFRARARWRQARPALDAALADAERQLCAARQALSEVKRDFAARLAVRAAAAAKLRHLTAECGAALARIAGGDSVHPPDDNAAASSGDGTPA